MAEKIKVEVVSGNAQQQKMVVLELPRGSTLIDAIIAADPGRHLSETEVDAKRAGVFGKRRAPDHRLNDGDRVEIYQPLKADPKEVRRRLAELNKTRQKDS